jgi:hypothetical protein
MSGVGHRLCNTVYVYIWIRTGSGWDTWCANIYFVHKVHYNYCDYDICVFSIMMGQINMLARGCLSEYLIINSKGSLYGG